MTHETNVDRGTEPYRTLASHGRAEVVVERSRFLALACPIRSDADADATVMYFLLTIPALLSATSKTKGSTIPSPL
jgi:hypothetical protein